ncbi:pimeloyl-ACP methyl ester carboxylesterase [Actinoplanes lutulentus]|uniref:Pimeloyl-ACP methyl ester carboxylesterase n=1 Tax=Actinoplanes lutulentus TaxID=1287878 RepID=A0A327Z4I3_9ACTN|nr:alpha/beta hydrolase [Actinoplanes lutulentus]MBB2947042.1 pimeloyl-ACP methyl ester carboxylesterase [Actinoplanes lutulentus]RAK30541.1 pimeloyl-ACP methyl ester carboxylesterase [Actinoplanes lutulentus]
MLRAIKTTAAFAAVAAIGLFTMPAAEAGGRPGPKPTIVLVHGAFADSSGFNAVAKRLLAGGYPVVSAPNPLRGLTHDATQVRALLDSISGPIVLVGHSYGGAVISTAATGNANVKALVYLAAFVPETGESAEQLAGKFPGSTVGTSLKPVPLPDGQVDLYINPAVFHPNFAGDLPARDAALYAIAQRPATGAALGEPASAPQAWHDIPSYDLISGADRIIPPAAQEFMAKRAGAKIQVVRGASHLVFVSQPDTTVAFIERAVRETAR